jgi:hypothetical protein
MKYAGDTMDSFFPTVKIYNIDIYCDGCGSKIKSGSMILFFPTNEPGKKFFCCKKECGGDQFMIFLLDLDNLSTD